MQRTCVDGCGCDDEGLVLLLATFASFLFIIAGVHTYIIS